MNPSPNLFLIGPMGSGKSSIGRQLAAHFALPFFDLDAAIEQRTGTSVARIFDIEGESAFRARESAMLAELGERDGIVLATGGGTVLASRNRERLRAHGFVAWLEAGVEQQLQRLARDRQRPLLDAPDRRTRLAHLALERDPLYRALADLAVPSEPGENVQHAAERLITLLGRHWQRVPIPGEPA